MKNYTNHYINGQSGNGRENGKFGFEEFLEFKALQLPVPAKA